MHTVWSLRLVLKRKYQCILSGHCDGFKENKAMHTLWSLRLVL